VVWEGSGRAWPLPDSMRRREETGQSARPCGPGASRRPYRNASVVSAVFDRWNEGPDTTAASIENAQLTPTLLLPTRTGSHEPADRGQELLSRLRKSSRRTSALSLGRRALLISDASAGRRDTLRSVPSASLVIQGCLAVATERQSQVTAGRSSSTAASPAGVVIWARAPAALSDVAQCATLPWGPATAAPECASATMIEADVAGSSNSRGLRHYLWSRQVAEWVGRHCSLCSRLAVGARAVAVNRGLGLRELALLVAQ